MKKNKNIVIIFGVFILALLIGYLISNYLSNKDESVIKKNIDVRFENIVVDSGSVVANQEPKIVDNTTIDFNVKLNSVGDYYKFSFDVINKGNVNAMIGQINNTKLSDEIKKYYRFNIKYDHDKTVSENDLLKSGDKCKVIVTFYLKNEYKDKKDFDLEVNLDYIEAVHHAKEVLYNVYYNDLNNNKKADIGEEISIDTENFYVIGYNEKNNTIKALSKYNLFVGNQYNSNGKLVSLSNSTGLQNANALGKKIINNNIIYPINGVIKLSNKVYWSSNSTIDLSNTNNLINPYLSSYKTILENNNIKINNISLITKDEYDSLNNFYSNNLPSWLYETSYWTSSSSDDLENIYVIDSNLKLITSKYLDDSNYGIRPVITLNEDIL